MGGVEYQVTKVDPTDPETKGMVYQVHKVSEEVAATLGGKVYRARIINDPTEPTVVGKVYQIVLIGDPDDPAVKGKVYNAILTGGSEAVVVGPAVSPLSLPDAIANSLSYVKAFGGTEQRNLPDGYTQLEYIGGTGTQYIDTGVLGTNVTAFELKGTIAANGGQNTQFIGGTNQAATSFFGARASSVITWYCMTAQGSSIGNPSHVCVITSTIESASSQPGTLYDTETGTTTEYAKFALTTWGFGEENILLFGGSEKRRSSNATCYYLKLYTANGLAFYGIPAKNSSNAVGLYDVVSGTFFTNGGTGDFVAGPTVVPTPDAPMDIVSNNGVLRIQGSATGTGTQTGTPTPTTPIYPVFYQKGDLVLRAVDGYADTYDATTQTITRNIGAKVLDGTEDWETTSTAGLWLLRNVEETILPSTCICTHFLGVSTTTVALNMPDLSIRYGVTGYDNRLYIRHNSLASVDDLKQLLADQYNAGTPVIVYYALETPITESFTPSVYADGTVETIGVKDSNNLLPADAQPDILYPVTVSGAGNWTASANVNNGQNLSACEIRYYNENKQQIDYYTINGYSDGRMYKTFSVTTAVKYVSISRKAAYSTTPVTELKVETGNTMTPYFNGGTATTEMLLKIGDYQDIQSILDGVVTRNVGVKVLDGTEDWTASAVSSGRLVFYVTKASIGSDSTVLPNGSPNIKCSHFETSTAAAQSLYGTVWAGGTAINFTAGDFCANLTAWRQWLAEQYAAGTPVIVIYPLATPATESVAGQTLQVTDGDNVLEITQASLDGLELEAEYEKEAE